MDGVMRTENMLAFTPFNIFLESGDSRQLGQDYEGLFLLQPQPSFCWSLNKNTKT
jgi:hypothetical protein